MNLKDKTDIQSFKVNKYKIISTEILSLIFFYLQPLFNFAIFQTVLYQVCANEIQLTCAIDSIWNSHQIKLPLFWLQRPLCRNANIPSLILAIKYKVLTQHAIFSPFWNPGFSVPHKDVLPVSTQILLQSNEPHL